MLPRNEIKDKADEDIVKSDAKRDQRAKEEHGLGRTAASKRPTPGLDKQVMRSGSAGKKQKRGHLVGRYS